MAKTLVQRLDALNNAQLAQVYNLVSERKVSKFSDHSTAVKRTEAALVAAERDFSLVDNTISVILAGDRPLEGDARVITLLAKENPKAKGSKSEARFKIYRTGLTVGEYVGAVREMGDKRRKAIRDIFWDAEHGYISVG